MPFTKTETLLIFRIAGIPFAVPAESVGTILMPPPHITHAPGSARSTPGIFHHADFTYVVIDLHERFGIDTPRNSRGRLLLHEDGVRHFAFIVDEVVGLVRSEQGSWANLPHYLPQDLFSIGFLYQEEIVLCCELSHLRSMHDVEPLRRHFEQLQRNQEQPAEPITEPTTSVTEKLNQESSSESISTTTSENSENSADEASIESPPVTTVAQEKKADEPTAMVKTPTESKDTMAFHTPSRQEPVQPKAPKAASHSTLAASRPITPSASASAKSVPLHSPTAPTSHSPESVTTKNDSSLIWLAIFLLLLIAIPVAYIFWPQPPRHRQLPPVVKETPPPIVITEESYPSPSEPPLRIEQDKDGTINLIIDRKAAVTVEPTIAPPQNEQAVVKEESNGVEEEAVEEIAQSVDANVEPCDCTHIVVWGDTLWDIAERYTGNAFNYPELARRSGIKNPHRIYPGNRVRIIIR